jgi:hypothetical protein
MARTALKQTARCSQRAIKRPYYFWNQAKVRLAWKRGTSVLSGLPSGFLLFQARFGNGSVL